ncbi:hypothetical protein PSOS111911_19265 [Pseudoalteromonas ostreae]
MTLLLCLIAFFCVLLLMFNVRSCSKHSLGCIRCGVFVVGSLVTAAMYYAGIGVLRAVLIFIVSIFIVSLLITLVQPLELD